MESLFDAGFSRNLGQMCILRWSNGSQAIFNFWQNMIFWRIFQVSKFCKNRPLHLYNPCLTQDFHETCVKYASWHDVIVHEEIFNFCQNLTFWEFFQMSKFYQKSTFASMKSQFESGFPTNLHLMCIRGWPVSEEIFNFYQKLDFLQNFQM